MNKELYAIREWAPLTDITERIPSRIQRGFFPVDVNLTCVDAVNDFIALGSDVGIVFWYNRYTGEVQKLKAEVATRITCVKIVNSVEFMVAAGNSSGQVSVFQIQKELPPDLNLVAPCARPKPIERYTIRDLHRSTISCCEWSKNGMKLYSGDKLGVIVLTEFDYQTHISKSMEILCETYEIVQLSLHQSYLLVSTLYRSILCQRVDATGQWLITQVGKKDRKQLMDCGGTFLKHNLKNPRVVCGRPGLRFWVANMEGNVEKTLLFKDAIMRSPTWIIPILNPKLDINGSSMQISNTFDSTRNFRNLLLYAEQDALIVTHDEINLYILNLNNLCVEAVAKGFRKLLDFCVCGKEIFVLEGDRSLLRLAPTPEKPNKTAKIIFNPLMPPPVPLLGAAVCGTFESPVEYEPEEQTVTKAEECFELSPIDDKKKIPIELAVESPRAEQNRRFEIFNQISEMDFDQSILHHSGISVNGRKKRKDREQTIPTKSKGIVEIGQAVGEHVECAKNFNESKENELNNQQSINIENKNKLISKEPNIVEFTTKSTTMDVSYCMPESTKKFALNDRNAQHSYSKVDAKTKELGKELNLTKLNRNATDEAVAQKMPSALTIAYPRQTKVEDAGVQTTPRKQFYYMPDFSAGQPVDDICQTLRATNLLADTNETTNIVDILESNLDIEQEGAVGGDNAISANNKTGKQFVHMQPMNYEIDSFLLDFKRAQDPLRKRTPPPSGESTTSSEWEFLDN